ncbi:ABC transporter permease [Alicyclobacillus fastidiosus]|uniref:ABC transporter permease n=1 Tax=Alicyclobacillus fastidiosus TaxID=392011 RepID=A0ABV5ADV0_9BACL|nr:ABC transporter permease [Alicyclobacillus fastidiosus]WEH08524.1 ABC transporter permease [Alicyclobacillus fastidiosus]
MGAYIIRRIGQAIIVLIGISIIAFLLLYAVPADPARIIAGPHATPQTVQQIRIDLGLNLPIWEQYLKYMGNLLQGNLGTSYIFHTSVMSQISGRMGPTAELALGCWIMELLIGIPLGIYTARHANKVRDVVISALALVGISLPVYWLGLILLIVFGFKIPIFPLGGTGGIYHLILPAITYGITGAAYYLRLLKSTMLDVMNQDYVRTARAKGASERRVIYRHVLRNALIPVITFAGIDIGTLLAGVVLIEETFNWNGMGMLAYQAIGNQDIPVIMGTVLLLAVFVVVFNLLVDIAYGFVDPRIRYD